MKYPSSVVLSILFVGCLFVGCNDQEITASAPGESIPALGKVTIIEDYFDFENTGPGEYLDCTGAIMEWHGTIKANYRAVLTPSGHYIETGHVDYNAYGGITLENSSTHEVWTLQNGTNPWDWIEHHDGSLRFHYSGRSSTRQGIRHFISASRDSSHLTETAM